MRQELLVGLVVGTGAAIVAVGAALAIDAVSDGWPWHRFAVTFLAVAAFILLALFTRRGIDPPPLSAPGYDAIDSLMELRGRQEAETLHDYRQDIVSPEAITALPLLATVILAIALRWGV